MSEPNDGKQPEGADASKPSASKPSASKPSASKPSASKPSAAEPSAAEPSASEPAADEAVAVERTRKVRRSRHLEAPEGAADAQSAADADAAAATGDRAEASEAAADKETSEDRPDGERRDGAPPKRRRRRRRRRSERSEGDEGAPRGQGTEPGSPRGGPSGPPRERRPRSQGDRAPAARGQGPVRKVYRQDVPGMPTPPPGAPQGPQPRKPEPKKPEPKKPEPRPEHQDKITMILHPAPKAAPNRRGKKKDRPRTAKEAMQAKTAKRAPAGKAASRPQTAATTELQQVWLDADIATAADAVQAAGGSAGALVQAWLERSNAAAIACVASLDSVGGGVRRAARKALDALKERGVDIPEHGREAEGPDPHVATFIPPDGSGATFLSISQRQPSGRYHVADVVMRAPAGVVHASSAKLAGKHIRDWRNRIEKQYGAKPVEVSVDWARHRIAEARKLNDSSGQLVPLGFESCAALFSDTPEDAPQHPISDLEEAAFDKAEIEKAVLGSDEIHAHPELRSWLPNKAAVDELLSKVGQAVGGDEGASDSKVVDEALRTETTAATDRYFTPELRSALVDRMRDAAISVRARVGDEPARRMLAVAQAVRDAGLITSPPSEIPFLLSYFQKAVARLVRQGQGQLRVPVAPTP